MVIRHFRHRGLRLLFEQGSARGVPAQAAEKLADILAALSTGPLPEALRLPGYGLHALTGDRRGTWSVVVTRNWRLTFTINGGDADDVDFEDYH